MKTRNPYPLAVTTLIWLLVWASLLLPPTTWAQTADVSETQVVIYPGGVAYVQQLGSFKAGSGVVNLGRFPRSIPGALWVQPDGAFQIDAQEAVADTLGKPAIVTSLIDLLEANAGLNAEVTYQLGQDFETVFGEILPSISGADFVLLRKVGGNTVALQKTRIIQVNVVGEASLRYNKPAPDSSLRIRITPPQPYARIRLRYLQDGWQLRPSYTLELLTDSLALLRQTWSLDVPPHANSMPEATLSYQPDISQLPQVPGMPPLSLKPTPKSPTSLAKPQPSVKPSNTKPGTAKAVGDSAQAQPVAEPLAQQALKLGTHNLTPGQTINIPLSHDFITVRPLDRLQLPLLVPDSLSLPTGQPLRRDAQAVRQLELVNDTPRELPPGECWIQEGERPLGLVKLPTLDPGQKLLLPGGGLGDVLGWVQLQEFRRDKNAGKLGERKLTRVYFRGELWVHNLAANPRIFHIVAPIWGKLSTTSNASITTTGTSETGNDQHELCWSMSVGPNSKQALKLEFSVLMPE